jgi:hypothetical protein
VLDLNQLQTTQDSNASPIEGSGDEKRKKKMDIDFFSFFFSLDGTSVQQEEALSL